MSDSGVAPLLWLVAFQMTLYAAAWGVCSSLLRESRAAVAHWGVFLLLLGLALALAASRGEPRSWLLYNGANLATIIAFAAMRRGTERFMRVPDSDREQILVLLPLLALIVLTDPGEGAAPLRIVAVYVGPAYTVLRTMWTVRRALVQEFGRNAGVAMLVCGVAIGVVQAGFAAVQAWHWPLAMELQRGAPGTVGLMALCLGGGALFNIGFMVMLMLRLVVNLREASQIDALTGLFNRRAINQALDHAWQRHRRTLQPLTLLVVDVDPFKRIDDSLGDAAGDQVLVGLAALLQRQLRAVDMVGRIGDEQFQLLLPGADERQAAALAERLRHQVLAGSLGTTISVGVAQARRDDTSVDMLVARADQALCRAKSRGRNRVELALLEPLPSPA
jgi:diguanylate cyclase (GGDEF)-like protein